MSKLNHLVIFLLLNFCGVYRGVTGDEDMATGDEATTFAPDPESGAVPAESEAESELNKKSEKQVLDRINELREVHGSPKLVIDKTLATSAQKHAELMASTGKLAISCTKANCPGENLAMGPPNKKIATEIINCIQRWYNTYLQYDFSTGKAKNKTLPGAFTQLVWKNSKTVGIGAAVNPKTKYIYVVVQFLPAGNVAGAYKFNVKPSKRITAASIFPDRDEDKVTPKPNPKEDIPRGDAATDAAATPKPKPNMKPTTKPNSKGKVTAGDEPAGSEDAKPGAPSKKVEKNGGKQG